MPLSSNGLWDAEIITPRSHRIERVSMATAGVGQRAGLEHVDPDRGESGDQRGLDHVAGQPRVLADEDPVAMVAAPEDQAGGLADPQRELCRDHAVCAAANAVGAKIFSCHVPRETPGK